ncbi:protection of telomeres protein 1 isoform X2 [Camarhynchus parvulus]|uniref:protection of telomeres protein 1 isoform X2 n=1 Tax=Geospiza parvula TaxID=87175 RepID=UPI001237FA86|nr:protection of telomeres protein 1 isoform X2 [Camarhynchus parvulus]
MPVQLLKIIEGQSETPLPSHLQKEDLKHLQEGCDYTNKYIQGIVTLSYPLTKLRDGTDFFKIVVQDSDNLCSQINSINVFMYGKMAEDCAKIIRHGETFIVAGFKVIKLPTEREDARHDCHLEVSEEAGSTIYIYTKPGTTAASETASVSVAPKYVYTPLNHLKDGTVVNLYGVVKFFKPPYISKGTDYCSIVTLVDQSNVKLTCSLFSGNLDFLPKIYKVGDIVRFHRIKVWDGTECPYPTWKVPVEAKDLEGEKVLLHQLRNLAVDILVYDNHVQLAESLKIGSFLRIYSIHAKEASADNEDVSHMEFHLHGGTCYGRGIGVLPESNPDVKELKEFLESVTLTDSQNMESCSMDIDSTFGNVTDLELHLQRCQQLSVTVLTDHQDLSNTELKTITNSAAPQQYRIRAKLRTYKPQKLHQSVKLHCSKCNSLQEVPDRDDFDFILHGSAGTAPNPELHNTSWYESVTWTAQEQKQRKVAIHFVKRDEMLQHPEDTLIMIEGGTLKEIWKLTKRFKCVIPVRSTEDDLELLDLSAPFLLKGNVKYYGCKQCSTPKPMKNLSSIAAEQQPSWEPTEIAQVLGIELLQYVFIMKFTLVDETGSLNAYLFDDEKFFQIPASEILTSNFLQQKMQMTMNALCPPGRKLGDLPWLECFIKSYNVRDAMKNQVYYQIFDTTVAEDVV